MKRTMLLGCAVVLAGAVAWGEAAEAGRPLSPGGGGRKRITKRTTGVVFRTTKKALPYSGGDLTGEKATAAGAPDGAYRRAAPRTGVAKPTRRPTVQRTTGIVWKTTSRISPKRARFWSDASGHFDLKAGTATTRRTPKRLSKGTGIIEEIPIPSHKRGAKGSAGILEEIPIPSYKR